MIWVAGATRNLSRLLTATLLCLSVHACDTTTGGAVELSWRLRPASSALPDKFIDCNTNQPNTGNVTRIRLEWRVDSDSYSDDGFGSWQCGDNHGVTGFDLPPGTATLSIIPECDGFPADPATYIAPAPEQRDVIVGETISLGAMELVLQVNSCDVQPCICQ